MNLNIKKYYFHSKNEIIVLKESSAKEYLTDSFHEKSSSSKKIKNYRNKVSKLINKHKNIKSFASLALNNIYFSKSIINIMNLNKIQNYKKIMY